MFQQNRSKVWQQICNYSEMHELHSHIFKQVLQHMKVKRTHISQNI
jgi:hypothetical protein